MLILAAILIFLGAIMAAPVSAAPLASANIVVRLPDTTPFSIAELELVQSDLDKREECNVAYCTKAIQDCITDCSSLSKPQWYV